MYLPMFIHLVQYDHDHIVDQPLVMLVSDNLQALNVVDNNILSSKKRSRRSSPELRSPEVSANGASPRG